jgi:hypothetical protein
MATIPSSLDTAKFRHLVLDGLNTISAGGGTGGGGSVSTSASVTTFTSTASAELSPANNKKAVTIYNKGAGNLYVLLGTGTASSSNASLILVQGDIVTISGYNGAIQAIFDSTGTAFVTTFA